MALGFRPLESSCSSSCFMPGSGEGQGACRTGKEGIGTPRSHILCSLLEAMALPGGPYLLQQFQARGRDVLHTLTLCISSAGCRVPRSSVLSVTPSRLLETFGVSTYEGPSRRAGPSYSAQLITPRGRRTTTTKKRRFKT